jgi:hypothetical protein
LLLHFLSPLVFNFHFFFSLSLSLSNHAMAENGAAAPAAAADDVSSYVLPDKWTEDTVDEKGEKMSKTCVLFLFFSGSSSIAAVDEWLCQTPTLLPCFCSSFGSAISRCAWLSTWPRLRESSRMENKEQFKGARFLLKKARAAKTSIDRMPSLFLFCSPSLLHSLSFIPIRHDREFKRRLKAVETAKKKAEKKVRQRNEKEKEREREVVVVFPWSFIDLPPPLTSSL